MALISSCIRASTSVIRYWRSSPRPISSTGCLRCVAPCVQFSTIPKDLDLFQHIQAHHDFFGLPIPNEALSVPPEFPFHIEKLGLKPYDLRLRQWIRQDRIDIDVDKVSLGKNPSLQMSGLIVNEQQVMKFRMEAQPDNVRFNVISFRDRYSRHVEGSEKYLDAKGVNSSTITILFNYLSNRMIPSQEEFPFEIKDGFEKGTLTLRRKFENEIIIVGVRAVDEARILDKLADYEEADTFKSKTQSLDGLCQYDFEESMKIFEDEGVGNVEEVGDIGCLLMTVCVYYGNGYCKRIKLDVFAFLDQIAVPGFTLTDNSCNGFETYKTYFEERGIHVGTMNFMINYAKQIAMREEEIKLEAVPKVWGLFDESQMVAAMNEAEERVFSSWPY